MGDSPLQRNIKFAAATFVIAAKRG